MNINQTRDNTKSFGSRVIAFFIAFFMGISVFSDFSGEDFDGNKVDDSLFSGNAVTVVNFWFTGCKPCVAELSKLNELNDAIKSMLGGIDNKDNYDALMKQIQSVIDADSTNK